MALISAARRSVTRTAAHLDGASARRTALAVGLWGALVGGCIVVGFVLDARGLLVIGEVPPFHGSYRLVTVGLLPAVAYAGVAVISLPRLASTLRWRTLLLVSWAGCAGWACVLAASDGVGALAAPLANPDEYLAVAASIGGHPIAWLHGFTSNVASYPTHVAGHPPLPVLLFWVLDRLGLTGAGWEAALVITLGSSAVPAALVAARHAVGEHRARPAAPFLVLAPFVLTVATSADAMFLGVSAWGIALLAISARRGSVGLAVTAGILLGAVPYLNYGLLPLGAVAVAVIVVCPSGRAVLGALLGAGLVLGLFTAGGFWWPDGVLATHARWAAGSGSKRPYWYMLVADVALLAVITGPATWAALLRSLRTARLRLLVGAALLGVLVLDGSGVTRGEVGRIWLPFAPWVMLATAALPGGATRRGWLAAQAVVALFVQATVRLLW